VSIGVAVADCMQFFPPHEFARHAQLGHKVTPVAESASFQGHFPMVGNGMGPKIDVFCYLITAHAFRYEKDNLGLLNGEIHNTGLMVETKLRKSVFMCNSH